MTKKQATEILKRMRETGEVLKTRHHYGDNCIVSTGNQFYKVRDSFIRATGAGSWACKNTFDDFYSEVRNDDFVEFLPPNHYEYGL